MADAEVAAMGDDNLVADATAGSSNTPGPLAAGDGNHTEHASLLASQGEWDEAIGLLEKRLRTHRRDESARVLLADVYFQQAESLSGRGSRTAAIGLLERSLRTDPSHPRAAERLKQLRLAATASRPATPPIAAAPAASAARTPWVVAVPGNTTTNPVQPAVATVISPAASGTATLLRR